MSDDRYDIPDLPDTDGDGGGRGDDSRRRSRGPRRWLWLLVGIAVGVAGTLLFPTYVGPYLPGFFGFDRTAIRGQVIETSREEGRLLITVDSEQGAMLVTFHRRVPEIDLLVARGDSIVLSARAARPFLEDPELVGVRKGRWGVAGADTASASDTAAAPGSVRRDTAGAGAHPSGGAEPDTVRRDTAADAGPEPGDASPDSAGP